MYNYYRFVIFARLLTINERAAANSKLCESQNRHTARYALHEGTEKADDEEGDGNGDVDSDGNSSTQAKPNGVHTNLRCAVCVILYVSVCMWNCVCRTKDC